MPGEELDRISNRIEKVFYCMGHIRFVGGGRNLEFLTELRQLKERRFRVIGHRSSEI